MARLHLNVLTAGLATSLLLSLSCRSDRYQLLERKDGTLVRLDRRTGQIMMVEGATMSAVSEPRSSSLDSVLGTTKAWPDQKIPVPGDSALNVSIQSVWRGGNVFYRLTVTPAKRLQSVLRRSSTFGPQFTVNFEDEDGFRMLKVEVPISQMSRTVDDRGDPVSYEANGSVSAAREVYASVKGIRISWRL